MSGRSWRRTSFGKIKSFFQQIAHQAKDRDEESEAGADNVELSHVESGHREVQDGRSLCQAEVVFENMSIRGQSCRLVLAVTVYQV